MTLPTVLILGIAILTGLLGILFLCFPAWIGRLEEGLNAPWGGREIGAVRLGLSAEENVEQIINRDVLARRVTWDGWAKSHPRVIGVALCLVAVGLGWQM